MPSWSLIFRLPYLKRHGFCEDLLSKLVFRSQCSCDRFLIIIYHMSSSSNDPMMPVRLICLYKLVQDLKNVGVPFRALFIFGEMCLTCIKSCSQVFNSFSRRYK